MIRERGVVNKYKITVIMPALNEEDNLPASAGNVLDAFRRLDIRGELIIVNDGSEDGTGEIAERISACSPGIRVQHHAAPRGIGASFWKGVQEAEGEIVVMIPGDGENDASEILRYLPLMEQVDIVVPYICNPGVRGRMRRFLSFAYRGIINLTFGMSLKYLNGTVMYRRSILEGISLKSSGFFYQAELLIKTILCGHRYAEAPCMLKGRTQGSSKALTINSLSSVVNAYFSTLAEIYRHRESGPKVSANGRALK